MSKHLNVNTSWCKGCGICVAFCPREVLKLVNEKVAVTDGENCIKCGVCENLCPDFAICLVEEEA